MKNRKLKILLTGLALLLVTAGTTFAWWSASTKMQTQISMGNLKVSASFDEITDATNWEPGLYTELNGNIKNTGSVDTLVRVTSGSQVLFAGATEAVAADPEAIKLTLQPTQDEALWFKNNQGEAFVLLAPGEVAQVNGQVDFVGDKMGNDYMEAKLTLAADVTAAQALEGACLATFGFDMSELTDYFEVQSRSRSAQSPNVQRLYEVMGRQTK